LIFKFPKQVDALQGRDMAPEVVLSRTTEAPFSEEDVEVIRILRKADIVDGPAELYFIVQQFRPDFLYKSNLHAR
jgi:hypothetical protein